PLYPLSLHDALPICPTHFPFVLVRGLELLQEKHYCSAIPCKALRCHLTEGLRVPSRGNGRPNGFHEASGQAAPGWLLVLPWSVQDRKSTRLNSSHVA